MNCIGVQDINYEKREEQRKDEEEMLQGYKGFKEINPEFYLRKVPDPLLKPSFDQLSKERVNEALLIYECDVRARLSSTGLFATYRMIIGVGKVDFYTYDHVRKQIFLTPDTFFQIIPPEVRACCSWLRTSLNILCTLTLSFNCNSTPQLLIKSYVIG